MLVFVGASAVDGQAVDSIRIGNSDKDPSLQAFTIFRHFSLKNMLNFSVRNLAINHDVIDARYCNLNLAVEFGYCF